MRTFKRINEDYIDSIDRSEYTDRLTMDINTNVDMLMNGQVPNIDFNLIQEPIYKLDNDTFLINLIRKCTDMYGYDCNLNWIDVSQIETMSYLFCGINNSFIGDISKWDVSHVKRMNSMFYGSLFNGDISGWDVSSVRNMGRMFQSAKFNNDISKWNVSNVTNMYGMFSFSDFNGDISKWNTSKVKDMSQMFRCSEFNSDISSWSVQSVTKNYDMFSRCPLETQPEKQPKFKI